MRVFGCAVGVFVILVSFFAVGLPLHSVRMGRSLIGRAGFTVDLALMRQFSAVVQLY